MVNKKKITRSLLLITLLFQLFFPVSVQAKDDFSVKAAAGFAIDADSGKIFFDQNGETPLAIASVTKIITAYLVLDAIKQKKITWNEEVTISAYAEELSNKPDLSNIPLARGQKYSIRDLFDAMMIESANAAAVTLAEHLAGSEPDFVKKMRKQVAKWGIEDATLVNVSGLNNEDLGKNRFPGSSEKDENFLSAKDVAIIARQLIQDFPEILETTKTTKKMFGANTTTPFELTNWDSLLATKPGVDGLKTGTNDQAGSCFVGTIQRDGRRVITVILDAKESGENARFVETDKLMDYSLDHWQKKELLAAGQVIAQKTVNNGSEKQVDIKIKEPLQAWVRTDMDTTKQQTTPVLHFKDAFLRDGDLRAPLQKGEKLGYATLQLKQDTLGYLDKSKQPQAAIVARSGVKTSNWFQYILEKFLSFIHL